MKVRELIKILNDCDPDAEVLLASQPNYPFEYAVAGVVTREDFLDQDDSEGDEPELPNGERLDDVLLCEGQQLRYGDREAWNNVRTGRG
jgi:hypothetical protein